MDRFGSRAARRVDRLVWLAVWLPFVVLALLRAGTDWFPVQDQAVLDLRIRDLTRGLDAPLVGAFSRYGWSHPGPVWFVVLAPFRWLGGTTGILVGSMLWFGAGFATLAVLVRRRWGTAVAAAALVLTVPALAGAGWFALVVPWNPHLAFAWYPAFLVLCVAALGRRPDDLAPALLLGSLLVQLHVGYLPIVAVPLGVVVVRRARRVGWSSVRASLGRRRGFLVATVVVWIPPMLDQVVGGIDGNLVRLVGFFVHPPASAGPPAGWSFGAGVLAGVVRWPLTGLGGAGEPTDPFTGYLQPDGPWLLVPVALALLAVGWLAARRRRTEVVDAVWVAGAGLGAGLLALSRLVGERWAYLFTWRFALVWFALAVALLGLVATARAPAGPGARRVPGRDPRRRAHATGTALLLVLAIVAVDVVVLNGSVGATRDQVLPLERSTRVLTAAVASTPRPAGTVRLVRFGRSIEGVGDGVLDALDDAGWQVGVAPGLGRKYGPGRVVPDPATGVVWFVTESSAATTLATLLPGAEVVARTTPLAPAEERELVDLQVALFRRIQAANRMELIEVVDAELVGFAVDGKVDTTGIDLDRLSVLNGLVSRSGDCRCAVVRVPLATPDDPAHALATVST